MVRTKTTPKKEREGRTVLRTKKERARLASQARQEEETSGERRRGRQLARRVRKEEVTMKWPPLQCTTPPQPKAPHP